MNTTRPPIVTILGHVDHGKTTLLDFIRSSSVAAKEHGGITQHIGAYQVSAEDVAGGKGIKDSHLPPSTSQLITFIDTPGHAAFEKMRSRGARVADIAVLVVAVDDGIMPQTVEAIKHILEAKVPMVVAVNKIDLPGVNKEVQLQKIKKQLSDNKVLVEEYGGDVPIVEVSAKSGEGIKDLLETILLISEIHEFKADSSLPASGVVIEANLDKFKGSIATILVRNGTLKKGDAIVLNGIKGKVRGMFDWSGKAIDSAGPSTPVEVLGLEAVPLVGATLGEEAVQAQKVKETVDLLAKLRQDKSTILNVIVKADKQGSLEAIEDALDSFNVEEEHVKVISSGTADITESDIKMAASVSAIVIGFNVKISPPAAKLAEVEGVLVRTYNIIYELIDELSDVVEGMLKVGALEEIFGTAQIIAEFPYGKNEKIAGIRVVDGVVSKGPKIKVLRDEEVVAEGKIKSLKHLKEEVVRLEKGKEGGIMFDSAIDFQIGDVIQSFRTL